MQGGINACQRGPIIPGLVRGFSLGVPLKDLRPAFGVSLAAESTADNRRPAANVDISGIVVPRFGHAEIQLHAEGGFLGILGRRQAGAKNSRASAKRRKRIQENRSMVDHADNPMLSFTLLNLQQSQQRCGRLALCDCWGVAV